MIKDTDIARIYPAVIVGIEGEITPVSLEWFDTLSKEKVKSIAFALFLHLKNGEVKEFRYAKRELLDAAMETLASQL